MIQLHRMIQHQVLTNLHFGTRPHASGNTFKDVGRGFIGIEVAKSHEAHTGIERLQSYASLKRDNKNKSTLLRTVGALFMLSFILNIVLWFMLSDARIAIQYHIMTEHKDDTINTLWKGDTHE